MLVWWKKQRCVLSAIRYVFSEVARPSEPAMTISYGSTVVDRVPAPESGRATRDYPITLTPEQQKEQRRIDALAARPKPSAAKMPGVLQTWRYSWVEYQTKETVSGEVQAVGEKAARAAIRAKHGFEKWLPDRTKVEAVA